MGCPRPDSLWINAGPAKKADGFATIADRPDQLECLIDGRRITTDAAVAPGHSNAEAGAEWFVSARTVESHLRRILATLELAVLVTQLDEH